MDVNDISDLLNRLPPWARLVILSGVVAIAVALSFSSCAASAHVQRDGVHIDTVRVDYIIRSNNYSKIIP